MSRAPVPDPSAAGWSLAPPAAEVDGVPPPAPTGSDRYEVGAIVGRGGMGRVSIARDAVLGRDVALKELDPALADDGRARERMAREAAITARLDHPNIVAVHDIGALPDGRPFYTMRLVRGRSLSRAIGEAADLPARMALLRNVLAASEAVAAAHDAGIVHRDLKPANILLGHHAETQVVDWGLAVPTAEAEARWHPLPPVAEPGLGVAVGTPAYMSPEQARGLPPSPKDDVYSLGVTLHEVLVGAPPGRGTTGSVPATQLEAASATFATLDPQVPTELRAIVARALAPVDLRYPHAGALADDLLAWFEGRRISAHEYTPGELVARIVRAWRVPIAVGAAGALAVSAALAVGFQRTAAERDRAVAAERTASQARDEARLLLARTRIEQAVDATLDGRRARAETLATLALAEAEDPRARGVIAAFGRTDRPRASAAVPGPTCSWSVLGPGDALGCYADGTFRWIEGGAERWSRSAPWVGAAITPSGLETWTAGHLGPIVATADGTVLAEPPRLNDRWRATRPPSALRTGTELWLPSATQPCYGRLAALAMSADRRQAAALCDDGRLFVHEIETDVGVVIQTEASGDHAGAALAWLGTDRLVIGTLRGRLLVVDARTGQTVQRGDGDWGMAREVVVSDDARRIAVSGTIGGVAVWSVPTSSWIAELPAESRRSLRFDPDGALRIFDGTDRRWTLPATPRPTLLQVDSGVADVGISPDGTRLVVATGAGMLSVFDAETGEALLRQKLAEAVVKTAAFLDNDTLVASHLGADPLLLITLDGTPPVPLAPSRPQRRLARAPGGFVGADVTDGMRRWTGRDAVVVGPSDNYADLEPDGAGGWLLVGLQTIVHVVGDVTTPLGPSVEARGVAPYGDGYALALRDGVAVYGPDGVERTRLEPRGSDVRDLATSADGTRLAAGTLDGLIYVWSVPDGRLLAVLPGHRERVSAVEFAPDGTWLLSGSWDHGVRAWDLRALDTPVATLVAEVTASWGAPGGLGTAP